MSFNRNLYAFILYTVCTVYPTVHKSPLTSPAEDRAQILNKNMDVWDKDKTPYFFWFFVEINVELWKKALLSIIKLPS